MDDGRRFYPALFISFGKEGLWLLDGQLTSQYMNWYITYIHTYTHTHMYQVAAQYCSPEALLAEKKKAAITSCQLGTDWMG